MKILKLLFYSNLWIATLGGVFAAFLAWGNYAKFPSILFLFIPLSIFIAYTFLRLWQVNDYDSQTASERHVYFKKYQENIKWLNYCLCTIWLFCLFFFPIKFIFLLIPLALLSILYHPPKELKFINLNLREIPYLKSILVAICWGYLIYLLPALLIENFQWYFLYNFFFLTLYFWSITIPFDIRDLEQDKMKNVQTLASRLSPSKVKKISITLLLISSIFSLIGAYFGFLSNTLSYSLATSFLLSTYIVYKTNNQKPAWHFDAFIDGSMLLAPIIYILLKLAQL